MEVIIKVLANLLSKKCLRLKVMENKRYLSLDLIVVNVKEKKIR
jgi:hypothetical protein